MPKYTKENYRKALDLISEHANLALAARAIGCSPKIVWTWAKSSLLEQERGEENPTYIVKGWPSEDDPPVPFHVALATAKKLHALTADFRARSEITEGTKRMLFKQDGSPVWQVDAEAIALLGGDGPEQKKAAEELLGLKDFPYKHRINERGNPERIQAFEMVPVAATLKIAGMKAMMPQTWNVPEVKHVDASVTGAIKHMTATAKPKPAALPAPATGSPLVDRDPNNPARRALEAKLAEMRERGPENPRPRLNPAAPVKPQSSGADDREDTPYDPSQRPDLQLGKRVGSADGHTSKDVLPGGVRVV